MGVRGMGALEFRPALGPRASKPVPLEVAELTQLVKDIFSHRTEWAVNLKGKKAEALNTIVRVGTSAGGNRAKAVISWNPKTQEVRSGQTRLPEGFEHWILKFDGVADKALGDPKGFFNTANTVADLDDVDGWLGKTHWTVNSTANASYNEVRIWDGVVSDEDLETLHALGPDAL